MENGPKSWLTGCGCGCLSHVASFVLVYGLCVGAAFVAWEVFDIRERFLRGESVLAWGAAVGAGFSLVIGVVMVLVMQRVAFKRFQKSSLAAVQPATPGMPVPAGQAPQGGVVAGGAPAPMGAASPGVAGPGASEPPKAGCLMPGIWLGINALFTLGGLGAIAVGAMDSERAGVMMSQLAAGPLGLAWAGFLAAVVIHLFFKRAGAGVRVGVPIGCGFIGAITSVSLLLFFYAVIWPEL